MSLLTFQYGTYVNKVPTTSEPFRGGMQCYIDQAEH